MSEWDALNRLRYRASWFTLGEFRCPADHGRWNQVNVIGREPLVVFPHVPVTILQRGREPVVATPNHTIFYDPGQEYRRELRDPRGDACVFVALEDTALERLVERVDRRPGRAATSASRSSPARARRGRSSSTAACSRTSRSPPNPIGSWSRRPSP